MTRTQALLARLAGWVLLAFVLVVSVAAPASAHASLTSTTPADGSVVHSVTAVSVTFSESVGVSAGSLRIYGPTGSRVDAAAPTAGKGGTQVAVGLPADLPKGTYTAAWHVVSEDSHPISGAFTFSIGHPSSHVSAASLQGSTGRPVQTAYAVVRGLGFLAFAVFAGGIAFVLLCWPEGATDGRARRMLALAWVASLVAATLTFLLQGAYASNHGFAGMVNATLLDRTLHTRLGVCLLARIALLVAGGIGSYLVLGRSPRAGRSREPGPIVAWTVVMAALVATWSLAGHASVGRYVGLSVASDVIHLMAAGVWVGGLCLLAWTALRERDFGRAWDAVRVFSPIALTCVAVIIVTGSFQTWRDTGHWAALVHTTYGLLILAKIAGLLILMCLGYAARGAIGNFLVKRSSAAQAGDATARALRRLRGGVAFEVLVAVAVLGLTAVLVNTATGREAYTPVASTSQTFDTGTVRGSVTIVVKPATLGPQTVEIVLTDSHQRPYQPVEVEASLTLPERSIGPLPLHVSSDGGGRYHTAPAPIGIAGAWIVSVTIRSDDFDETTVTGDATVR